LVDKVHASHLEETYPYRLLDIVNVCRSCKWSTSYEAGSCLITLSSEVCSVKNCNIIQNTVARYIAVI